MCQEGPGGGPGPSRLSKRSESRTSLAADTAPPSNLAACHRSNPALRFAFAFADLLIYRGASVIMHPFGETNAMHYRKPRGFLGRIV